MDAEYDHLIAPHQIDSRLKLHIALKFAATPGLSATEATLSERLRESPWAISEALDELAGCGLLTRAGGPALGSFRRSERPEHIAALAALAEDFNDPFRRDCINAQVGEAQRERQFSTCLTVQPRGFLYAGLVIV